MKPHRFPSLVPWSLLSGIYCPFSDGFGSDDTEDPKYRAARHRMVQDQIAARSITNRAILKAMESVPRHEFVPAGYRSESYEDGPIPIGYGQTISQPYIVAFMTQELNPCPTDVVLEIGTGSGYQAAVLSRLVKHVCTIEIVEALARRSALDLGRLGFSNVEVRSGDGYSGWPEKSPFDAIIVTCAPEHIPQPLVDQLRDGGRMIIPVGPAWDQSLHLLSKERGRIHQGPILPVRFVPMTGLAKEQDGSPPC